MEGENSSILYKLTVLGSGGCGKTACTVQLVSCHFVEHYDPTIESCYRQQFQIDGKAAMLDILDTAGQDDYSTLRSSWIRSGEGFLILYSITDRSSFAEVETFRSLILRVKDAEASVPPPMVLVGNKHDLEDERQVASQEGSDLAKQWGCDFFEVSAKSRHNLQEAFFQVVRRVRERQPNSDGTGVKPAAAGKAKKGTCVLF